MNSILNIQEGLTEDESIAACELYRFYPESGTQYNTPGNITITVHNSDNFYLPACSWLEFEGDLVMKKDGGVYKEDVEIAFVNYGILYLFDLIKYHLNSTPVESVFNPGMVANIMGLATFPDNFKQGLIECWAADTNPLPELAKNSGFKQRQMFVLGCKPKPIGSFRFAVPLKRLFGFCDDYGKIMYGFTHSLVLTRGSSDNNALCHKPWAAATKAADEVETGQVKLRNIRWMLPRVTPSDVAKFALMKQIKDQVTLSCGFRMRQHISLTVPQNNVFTWRLGVRSSPEQPRFIFICFQTDKLNNQNKLNTVYDHLNLTSAHVLLNNDRYPLNDFETNFGANQIDHVYTDFISFRKKFYGIDPIISPTAVDPLDYRTIFPIFCFDVSRQNERLKSGVTDITLHCKFGGTVGANTTAHALIISDRRLKFKSDGEKLSVLS
jgi:hypothetical protein